MISTLRKDWLDSIVVVVAAVSLWLYAFSPVWVPWVQRKWKTWNTR